MHPWPYRVLLQLLTDVGLCYRSFQCHEFQRTDNKPQGPLYSTTALNEEIANLYPCITKAVQMAIFSYDYIFLTQTAGVNIFFH